MESTDALMGGQPGSVQAAVRAAVGSRAAFELKGVITPLTILRLRSKDLNLVYRQLKARVTQMPQFFEGAPVVLDLAELDGGVRGVPLAALAQAVRACGVVPVAVANVSSDEDRELVKSAGLGALQPGAGAPTPPRTAEEDPAEEPTQPHTPPPAARRQVAGTSDPRREVAARRQVAGTSDPGEVAGTSEREPGEVAGTSDPAPVRALPAAHRPPVVLRQPVRSGQEIYARRTDLIVLSSVNPGAQIYADGHIHVYGPLRGRAMAGSAGLTQARIFCQRLEAELVAIAGAYILADEIPPQYRGKPVQVYLENGECRIAPL